MRAVRRDAVIAVDQALVIALLECPHNAFHKGGVHGLVCAVIINPARHLLDILFPGFIVAGNDLIALLIEFVDTEAVLDDILIIDAELYLCLILDRQAVAVPAPDSGDLVAAHGPVAGDHILDK